MTTPSFDPRELGANCNDCPLQQSRPVSPQYNQNPRLIVLGEHPGRADEQEQVPFSGGSGRQLQAACKSFGVKRSELHISSALLCKPPHKGFRPKDWKQALECCRPRLEAELADIKPGVPVFAAGAKALQALTGKAKILPWVGAPIASHLGRVVVPSIHPGLAMLKPSLLPVFRIFFGRAMQLADGKLPDWEWPEIEVNEGLRMVQLLESMRGKPLGVDVETAGLDPMTADLLCVGLASPNEAISVRFPIEDMQVKNLVEELLGDEATVKVLQNGGHDLLAFKHNAITVRGPIFDLLLAHAVVGPQLPHDLGFIAAVEFHAPRWKSEFRVESDVKGAERFVKADAGDLRLYNAKDAYMQVRLMEPMLRRLGETHKGPELFAEYTQLAELAMRMREGGMKVDTSRFDAHRTALSALMQDSERRFREQVPDIQYELGKSGQHHSIKRLFFEGFGVRATRFTEEGEPQLDKQTLKDIKLIGGQVAEVADATLVFREASKLRSTYLDGLVLDRNSNLHTIWKPWGSISRWSSADPNAQNWPGRMRDIVIASRPEFLIVGADFRALELRVVALLAGDEKLLKWYADDADVHTFTAQALFGIKSPGKYERDIAKTVAFGVNYNASSDVTTIWKAAQSKLPKKLAEMLTLQRLQKYRKIWFDEHPWIRQWQLDTIKSADKLKYVEAPLSGGRRYFYDGMVDPNEALNFPVQRTAGDLCNRAILKLDALLDHSKGERIIAQIHDAIYVEGPDADRLKGLLVSSMTQTVSLYGRTVEFSVDVSVGRDWTCSLKYPSEKESSNICFNRFMESLSSWSLSAPAKDF